MVTALRAAPVRESTVLPLSAAATCAAENVGDSFDCACTADSGVVAADPPRPCVTPGTRASGLNAAASVRGEPELTKPCTSAAPTASTTAAGTTTSTSLRFLDLCRGAAGALSSTRCRRRSGATGGFACSSETRASYPSISLPSNADIGHLLFQSLQSPAQPGRTSCSADSEHARRARPVELQQHAQRHHLALRRRQPPQCSVELRRQALGE